mmetsp:Transcript_34709/g.75969  ORF Transcript_34709/g.75969 Transcript_34709/m.75969 type:complete len:106 (-) Transcript_34709:597-914(-)
MYVLHRAKAKMASNSGPSSAAAAALADIVKEIPTPVLAIGTFVICTVLHFVFGVASKIISNKSKKKKSSTGTSAAGTAGSTHVRRRAPAKRMSSLFRACENDANE